MLANRPSNRTTVAAIGSAFGRCGHLLDAVADLDSDRARRLQPACSTGTTVQQARTECLRRIIADGGDDLDLTEDRLVRATLVRGLHHSISRTFASR